MRSKGQVILALGILVVIDFWGIGLIPFQNIVGENMWAGVLQHFSAGVAWILGMKLLCPEALRRLKLKVGRRELLTIGAILLIFANPFTSGVTFRAFSIAHIAAVFVFSFSIGLDEELFSRGLAYGLLEHFGAKFAILISSFEFGLLHLSNILWGGQSFNYTAAQVINAFAFGVLSAALLLYTRSIWPPIVFHCLSDFPLMFQESSLQLHLSEEHPEWALTLIDSGLYLLAGFLLLVSSNDKFRLRSFRLLGLMGLADTSEAKAINDYI